MTPREQELQAALEELVDVSAWIGGWAFGVTLRDHVNYEYFIREYPRHVAATRHAREVLESAA